MSRKRSLALPLFLGLITFALILLALWPEPTPETTIVVAARDLGAGTMLAPADLTTRTLSTDQTPPDAVSDPTSLTGRSLAVARFQGEAVSPKHLGPALALQPGERAVAVQVTRDRGLAGLLRPGMQVGVVATLPDSNGDLFAKVVLENLRVLYISPEFQARPATPASAQMTVQSGETTGVQSSPGQNSTPSNEGVIVLAAPIVPQSVSYVPITHTVPADSELVLEEEPVLDQATFQKNLRQVGLDFQNAESKVVSPVELLAALNAEKEALTLFLMPAEAEPLFSNGLRLPDLAPLPPDLAEGTP